MSFCAYSVSIGALLLVSLVPRPAKASNGVDGIILVGGVILVGLACLTAASLGFVWAPGYQWLVVARFTQGLGATAIWVGGLTLAADLSPAEYHISADHCALR